ncbi:MAG TPA: hypothetical protein ENJ27_01150 [Candidatus Moranbacteria bacterium]|nr:hypothetical protein [Candidatus Moranbacteria bacterium]
MIKYFLKNKRRYIDLKNLSEKTKKEKISKIYKFLMFCKKEIQIKKLNQINENIILQYENFIRSKGIWNRNKKQFIKVSEKKIKEHLSEIKKFYLKIKIAG